MRKLGQAIHAFFGSLAISDPIGWVFGAATGGAKGANTINATGLFVNGVAVSTSAGGTTLTTFVKAADTTRNSTIAPANDPDLITGSLVAGSYVVELFASFNDAGGAGFKYTFNFTGTQTTPANGTSLNDTVNPATSFYRTNAASTQNITNGGSVAGTGDQVYTAFVLVVTVAGVLSLQWAQGSSNVANLTLKAGSTMRYQKVA